jgi:hypothetical protein
MGWVYRMMVHGMGVQNDGAWDGSTDNVSAISRADSLRLFGVTSVHDCKCVLRFQHIMRPTAISWNPNR